VRSRIFFPLELGLGMQKPSMDENNSALVPHPCAPLSEFSVPLLPASDDQATAKAAALPYSTCVSCQPEAELARFGAMERPLDPKSASNFAFANRLMLVRV
jgi:hypothetical protein